MFPGNRDMLFAKCSLVVCLVALINYTNGHRDKDDVVHCLEPTRRERVDWRSSGTSTRITAHECLRWIIDQGINLPLDILGGYVFFLIG